MSQEIDLVACLLAFQPGAEWKIDNNDYSSLEWYSVTDKPTLEQLENCWLQVLESKQLKLDELAQKAAARVDLLNRLGITAQEADLLVG